MAQFLTDENFDRRILRGLLRQRPDLNIARVQDVNLRSTDDRVILDWAYQTNRVLLTHDISTVTRFSTERIASGLGTSGIIVVNEDAPIGRVIEELLFLIEYNAEEWENTIWLIPLSR